MPRLLDWHVSHPRKQQIMILILLLLKINLGIACAGNSYMKLEPKIDLIDKCTIVVYFDD